MNLHSTNVRTKQDTLCIKGHCTCTYFRIRAQVALYLTYALG